MRKRFKKIKDFLNRNKATRNIIVFLFILLLVSAIVISLRPDEKINRSAEISLTENGFEPSHLVIDRGTHVIWKNNDKTLHQVSSNPHPTGEALPGLKSEILDNEQTYEYTFDQKGNFGYHDYLKPTINGVVEVR